MTGHDDNHAGNSSEKEQRSDRYDAEVTAFYKLEARKLANYLISVNTGSPGRDIGQLTQDVVQDAFLAVRERWPKIRDKRPYLYKVARNQMVKLLIKEQESGNLLPAGAEIREDYQDLHVDDQVADHLDIYALLLRLPERQREVIYLYFICDFPQKKVAKIMQIKIGTVKSLIFQALARLKELLGDELRRMDQ